MMKIIKLIVLIAIVAGIIVGVMFLPSIIGSTGSPGGDNQPYRELSEKIDQQWRQPESTWSMDAFNRLVADIDVRRKNFKDNDYMTLRKSNADDAMKILRKIMMDKFEHNGSNNEIKTLNDNVKTLKGDPNNLLEGNSDIKECEETYKLYISILNYRPSSFSPNLKVDRGKGTITYTQYSEHKQRVTNQTNKYKSSSYYSHLKNRTDVDKAFKDVEEKVNKQAHDGNRYPFFDKVVNAIKNEFGENYTQENLDLLIQVCKILNNDLKGALGVTKSEDYLRKNISKYRDDFEKEVKEQNKNN